MARNTACRVSASPPAILVPCAALPCIDERATASCAHPATGHRLVNATRRTSSMIHPPSPAFHGIRAVPVLILMPSLSSSSCSSSRAEPPRHCRRRPKLRLPRPPSIRHLRSPSPRFLTGGASPRRPRRVPLLTRPLPLPYRAAGEPLRPPPPNAAAPAVRRRSPTSELPVRFAASSSSPCARSPRSAPPALPCRAALRSSRRRPCRRARVFH